MLLLCTILTIGLAAYSLAHYFCIPVFLLGRPRSRSFDDHPGDPVTVLIPARNEGEAVVRAVRSVLDQDHRGPVEVLVLLMDASDSSVPFLESEFPGTRLAEAGSDLAVVRDAGDRKVSVAFTGDDSKSQKVNWAIGRIASPYVAILDGDHQAHPGWVRTSLCTMREKGARICQGRRGPLSARGFCRLWDSLHQHVGCELFNAAFTRLGLTVFFTGTTVVMETSLLREHPLSRCITEDVDFSYRIVLAGERIVANLHHGSDEEVSPDIYSFLARRRRWANGHTAAFFRHLPRLQASPLPLAGRIQFVYHGLHYLTALAVFLLHLAIGLVLLGNLPPFSTVTAGMAGLALAAAVSGTQRSSGLLTRSLEVAVLACWLFPAVVIAMNLVHSVLLDDIARAAIPMADAVQVLGLVGLAAPLVILLVGLAGFGRLRAGSFTRVVLSFPIAFYLDCSGVLIGLADCLSGRRVWDVIARDGSRQGPRPASLVPAALALGLFAAGAIYTSGTRIAVEDRACDVLEHDSHPWIMPPGRVPGYCGPAGGDSEQRLATRTGSFELRRADDLETVDPAFWDRLSTTFFCNLAVFAPENVVARQGGGVELRMETRAGGGKAFTSGSIATKNSIDAKFLYGRFEAMLRPVKAPGVITAFFLYRFDPWQEIDAEFLGRDTTRLLANVFYNPGEEGDLFNYGYRGTPVLIDLGFDASEALHRYAIEWDPGEVRWFADGRLIHRRAAGRPTPIPHLPMRLHVNAWPICSEELAGPFRPEALPLAAEVGSISISAWRPAPFARYSAFVDSLFSGQPVRDWRDDAAWLQQGTR